MELACVRHLVFDEELPCRAVDDFIGSVAEEINYRFGRVEYSRLRLKIYTRRQLCHWRTSSCCGCAPCIEMKVVSISIVCDRMSISCGNALHVRVDRASTTEVSTWDASYSAMDSMSKR